jgi:Glycosyl hydrolase family 9/Cellulase N-terminal ig-like domain
MTYRLIIVLLVISLITKGQEPMKVNVQNSALYRWLNKEVLECRTLDNMETTDYWVPFTSGTISIVDSRITAKISESKNMVTEMNLSDKKSHDGSKSLIIRFPSKMDGPGPKSGRGWGNAGVWRIFENENWSKFNRISIWIYPDNPGTYQNWLELRLFNEGLEKLPALFGQEGENIVNLHNHEWNHVVWEIGNVSRDKISKLEISTIMSGNEPETTDTLAFYLDDLELEKVEPDYIEGWPVWNGRISFSHTGYLSGSPKSAIANDLKASEFRIVEEKSGQIVLKKPIQTITSHLGAFQVLDFSEIQQSGSYYIEAGKTVTQPFRIGNDIWQQTIWKVLNFFYNERCGIAIPGVHGECHRDWTCVHDEKKIVINGGWHDAGDFTQGLRNTGEAVYAMFSLAEQMHKKGDESRLYERLLEEAQWGLDWILKTSFGDGFRNEGSVNSRRTNGIIGDFDDVTSIAKNTPKSNFIASSAEAIAYRVLKQRDPRLANYALKKAKADWQFAVEKLVPDEKPDSNAVWSVSFDSGNILHEVASAGILASVELWHATGDSCYATKGIELAKIILESQQRKILTTDIPLNGFFYTGPSKKYIMHYCHNGREQEPIAALTLLCEAFPNHPDWMKWYSSVVLHSQYLKTIAKYTEPYGVLPSSIYTDKDWLQVPESRQQSFRQQVLNGIPLGKGYYLRIFPVWMDYRGHFGTILSQAQALNNAARLRGDPESSRLALHQLEWIVGRNPFSQSTMYGEGYDFPPLYTPSSGDITGALPVGIQTRAESDTPYWPVQSTWTYKEVWVHPVSQWIGLMRDIEGPAVVQGKADNSFNFEVSEESTSKGEVTITARVQGSGSHKFFIRTNNLKIKDPAKMVNLKSANNTNLVWHAKTESVDEPWVAVIVADNDLASHKELVGKGIN